MKELYINLGENIITFYRNSVKLAKETNETYFFEGNGIKFIAAPNSNPNLAEKYLDDCYNYDIKELGPDELVIDPEYKALKTKENKERAERLEAEFNKKREQKVKTFNHVKELVKDVQLDFLTNKEYIKWKEKNSDSYSFACFVYAEYLAKFLELVLQNKYQYTKEDIDNCESMLNYLDITGFQHGCVISILEHYWVHYNKEIFTI